MVNLALVMPSIYMMQVLVVAFTDWAGGFCEP